MKVNLIYQHETHFPQSTNKQYDFIIKSRISYRLSGCVHNVCILSKTYCMEGNQNNVHENNFIKLLFTQFHIAAETEARIH